MSFDYLNEAFKKLSLLNEETFDTSLTGLNQLSDFMDKDASDDVVKVIDTEAEFEDEVQDSYIGKVITNCNVCHSHIFENKDEIVIDEDGLVNAEKPCPYCGEQAGFTIVGEITPYVKETEEPEADPAVEVDGTPVEDDTSASEEPVDESVLGTLGLAAGAGLVGGAATAVGKHVTSKILGASDDAEKEEKEEKEPLEEGIGGALVGGALGASAGKGLIGKAVGGVAGAIAGSHIQNKLSEDEENVDEGLGGAVIGGALGASAGKGLVGKAVGGVAGAIAGSHIQNKLSEEDELDEGVGGAAIGGVAGNLVGRNVGKAAGKGLGTAGGAIAGAALGGAAGGVPGAVAGAVLGAGTGRAIGGMAGKSLGKAAGTIGGAIAGSKIGDKLKEEDEVDEGLGGALVGGALGATSAKTPVGKVVGGVAGAIAGSHIQNKLSEEDLDEAGVAVLDRPREKDLTQIKGTIADVLINHSAEIDACGANETAVKECITRILSSDEVKDPEAAQEAIRIINKCRGPKLWSTIGTYMSGLKVASSGKYARRRLDASLEEDVNNVNVETDDSIVNIHAEEGGKVTVSTEPKAPEATGEEAIGPLSDETLADIESANGLADNAPVEGEEEAPVEGEEEMDIDEVDETALDELGESYLKEVYENVESFKTSNVSSTDTHLVVEGVIKFKSGATKKTGFIFEAHSVTPDGKVRFTGKNEHFSRGAKSFILTGKIENKKLISESFTYNYRAKTADGKSNRIYGTVSKK